jgi:glycosyltransferase involved in cell wall biosynthesis
MASESLDQSLRISDVATIRKGIVPVARRRESVLYICYQSIGEPLTQTQVVSYLEGLVLVGYQVILLTFEPKRLSTDEGRAWESRLSLKGLVWHWVRYHKHPRIPATAWDVVNGVVQGARLGRCYNVTVVHARGHVAGLIALQVGRLIGARLLFDMRGFMAEEYADAGLWRSHGTMFRAVKRVEQRLVRSADAIVVLTQKARALLQEWYPQALSGKILEVIPCCVDMRVSKNNDARQPFRPIPGGRSNRPFVFVYTGKLGGWYLTEAMVEFVATARDRLGSQRWLVWTQSDPRELEGFIRERGLESEVVIGSAAPDALAASVTLGDAGLSFIKQCLSKRASSPTKVGEYLAAGLPVVASSGVGDVDDLIAPARVGVVVSELTTMGYLKAVDEAVALAADPDTAGRCRLVARECLDLEGVGWARYRKLYRELLA